MTTPTASRLRAPMPLPTPASASAILRTLARIAARFRPKRPNLHRLSQGKRDRMSPSTLERLHLPF